MQDRNQQKHRNFMQDNETGRGHGAQGIDQEPGEENAGHTERNKKHKKERINLTETLQKKVTSPWNKKRINCFGKGITQIRKIERI